MKNIAYQTKRAVYGFTGGWNPRRHRHHRRFDWAAAPSGTEGGV